MLRYQASVVVALIACTAGCSSAYIPEPGPRLSVVVENGTLSYVRDGKTYEGGFLGGDIEDAVSGNERAEEYAHDYKTGMVTGFAMSMIGIAGMVGGAALAAVDVGRPTANDSSLGATGLVVVGAGLILDLIGSGLMVGAVPHLYDAINAYNDGVPGYPPRRPAPPRAAAPQPLAPPPSQAAPTPPAPQPAAPEAVAPDAGQ
jgi:hypothetical protein